MTTPPLSPAAQAVLDAYHRELPPDGQPGGIAAAIRASAHHVKPSIPSTDWGHGFAVGVLSMRDELLAIAAELDGGNTTTETTND